MFIYLNLILFRKCNAPHAITGRGDDYLDRTTVTTGRGAGVAKRRRGLGALKAGIV
jgi:hypothetical protein